MTSGNAGKYFGTGLNFKMINLEQILQLLNLCLLFTCLFGMTMTDLTVSEQSEVLQRVADTAWRLYLGLSTYGIPIGIPFSIHKILRAERKLPLALPF